MQKNLFAKGFGVILLFSLIFTGCVQPTDPVSENVEEFTVTNLPSTVGSEPAFKIFAQLSTGTGKDAGYVAKGGVLLQGQTSVTIPLSDPDGNSWSGKGKFNVAIAISPQNAPTAAAILVHAAQPGSSTKVLSFNWENMIDLATMPGYEQQIQDIFEGIICDPLETDVTHPPKP
jgi:hypothetical protein